MALSWNIEDCDQDKVFVWEDYDKKEHGNIDKIPARSLRELDDVAQVRVINPTTNAMIWATLSVHMSEITKDNAEEFWTRLCTYEKLCGALMVARGGPVPFTAQDVVDNIGLKVNVSYKTRTQWRTWMFNIAERNARQAAEQSMATN